MQCLFCGKELALLKRLRGGGEFCSEAHRKEYQEQYEQLALARLLQAKPSGEPSSPGSLQNSRVPLNAPDPRLTNTYAEAPAPVPAAAPAPVRAWSDPPVPSPSPVALVETQASSADAEESGPAPLAGFVSEPVVPAVTLFEQAGLLEMDNTWERVASLPSFSGNSASTNGASANGANFSDSALGSQGCLPPAPRVELSLSLKALDHHTRTSERGMELREFTGPAPVMELNLRPETGSQPAGADDVMEILMSPHPPQKAKPWLGAPHGFPAGPAEFLGDLARLDFATTGFAYSDGPVAPPQTTQSQSPASQTAVSQETLLAPAIPSAPPQPVLQAEPPPAAFVAPVEPSAPVQSSPASAPIAAEPAPPQLVTKALPVTLHGLAASRGKLTQTFPTAITAASDIQIPPTVTLPLRPTIVFGPKPAPARAPEIAASPVRPEQVQPRPVQPTPAQSNPGERARSSVVPAPKAVPIKRQAASETAKPPASSAPVLNPRVESPAPKPREANDSLQNDTFQNAVPSWDMKATDSAWSRLSTGLKIGVAAAVIVGVSGIAYLVTRGNGKAAPEAPVAATASSAVATGVAISGGWIDDWANSARSRRHISLLSGSAKLSDYRLEFQAQIETKAIGWIFRGLNPRNYYVTKLEIVTPGLEPTVALVHFAVVDGQDENRVVVPLSLKARIDTTYKIRFDAIGNHFTTWVQGQKVDEWTDSRFGSGGVGFLSERDEKAAMQGPVNVVPLIPKN